MTPNSAAGQRRQPGQEGFSLVELAIVLIIIGLIVGGVLKGQDLIESARVNSIQSQINEIRVGHTTFQNKYDAIPGDFADAIAQLPGTTGWATSANGNGNGTVDGARAGTTATEATWYWQHLRAAGMLSGVAPNVNRQLGSAAAGLQSRLGGLYTIAYDTTNLPSTTNPNVGHWIRLGAYNTTDNNLAVLGSTALRGIDAKGDDGNALTGNIGAGQTTGTPCYSTTAGATLGTYTGGTGSDCWANFKL